MESKSYACSIPASGDVPACGTIGLAERMWNLDRKATGGKLVIVCGKHAHMARKSVPAIRAFRLSETLERDAKRDAANRAAHDFFRDLAKGREIMKRSAARASGDHNP